MYQRILLLAAALITGTAFSTISMAQQELPNPTRRSIDHVAGDVYRFTNDSHVSVFMVTDEGVIATDPINAEAAAWLNDEIQKRFNQPVKYVIYSHDHWDHVSGGAEFDGATIIAHENTREPISSQSEHPIAMPHVTYSDTLAVDLGGKRVEIFYLGEGHSKSMSYMRFPEERILFVVDTMEMNLVAFRDFPGDDIDGILSSLAALEEVDFDILVAGHSVAEDHNPVGTRDELAAYHTYVRTLKERVAAELAEGKSVDEIKATVTMSEYKDAGMYEGWQPMNVEGMVRYLSAQ